MTKESAKPFLKWAGGKYKLAKEISSYIGAAKGRTYFEPFLGGGSVFFETKPTRAVLADENKSLISAYKCVQRDHRKVHKRLLEIAATHSTRNYYKVRELYNAGAGGAYEQAARFIYLNKAGFNGIYRVNRKGSYNVPTGGRVTLALPTEKELASVSIRLKNVALIHADFELAVSYAKAGDVVYLDPPYPPLNESSFFNHYTADRFSSEEQSRVALVADDLKMRGCKVIVSNADTPTIRALYPHWKKHSIQLRRWITSAKEKHFVKELILVSESGNEY